jgi:uroporphyrinogen-III synthase
VLIWTRSLQDWENDRSVLGQLQEDTLHLPCIELAPLSVKFPKAKPQIFIFTSANGVSFAAQHTALVNLMRTAEAIYAIGQATADALRSLRLTAHVPLDNASGEQFATWLANHLRPGSCLVWPCAKEPAYDLVEHLRHFHLTVERLPVYHTERCLRAPNGKRPDQTCVQRYVQTLEGVVCFASPSAVDGFVKTLGPAENRLRKELTAIAIGDTTASACRDHFDQVIIAKQHTLESLVHCAWETYQASDATTRKQIDS